MSKTYKVGVIGVGGIAKTHMPGWNASGITEVVAACDIDRAAVEKFGAEWKIPGLTTDAADLFRNPDIDIIDVCTPNNYHAPLSDRGHGSRQARDLREAAGPQPRARFAT